MPFIDLSKIKPQEIFPGTRIRAPYGEKLMLSYVEIDEGAEVPLHSHPHEQGGVVLKGQMELTIGSETKVLKPGSLYLIPSNMPHKATALAGPVKALDVFSPIREDYITENAKSFSDHKDTKDTEY
ncbi:cupin domain-containing protein [Acidobacteria bacterium AH-259-L09]|nr:cupin domain-containing protein [Acidobacteria bacterium AH-259-L09]